MGQEIVLSDDLQGLMVSSDDIGRVIGKEGRNAKAIRTLVQASSYLKDNKKVKINIDSF